MVTGVIRPPDPLMVFAKAVNLAGDGKRSATADGRVGEAADVATMLTNDVQLTHERPFLSPTAPDPPNRVLRM